MQYRSIGTLNVSQVGIGTNNFGMGLEQDGASSVVDAALEGGINFFDTADVYGGGQSEIMLGAALGARRNQAIIASKFGYGKGAAPAYVVEAAEASLRRLGTDFIDLYYIHAPDPATPIADTLGALSRLKREGKVREIGCSNFSAEQLNEALGVESEAHFVSVENEYNLLSREPEAGVLDICRAKKLGFVPWGPLKGGLLTGKYRKHQEKPTSGRAHGPMGGYFLPQMTERNLEMVERLIAFAEARGHTVLELAFSWLLGEPVVSSVIAGAMSPQQVRANLAAARWTLSDGDRAEVDRILGQVGETTAVR